MYFDKTVIVHKFQQIKMYSKADIECFVVFNCMQKALLSHQLSCRYIYPQEKDYIHVLQVYLVSCDSLISFKSAMWYYSQHIYRVSIAVFKLCHLTIIISYGRQLSQLLKNIFRKMNLFKIGQYLLFKTF